MRLLPELSDGEYERLGVLPMSRLPDFLRERIAIEASQPRAPEKLWPPLRLRPLSQSPSRSWFEWHVRRGRDPRTVRERTPEWMRQFVVERDGMVCALCGLEITTKKELHIDHIKPVARGGKTVPSNLQPAHAFCNISKHDRWEE